ALARAVTCPSWIGRVSCAAAVVGRFAAPAPAASGSMAPALSAAQLCERSLAEALAGEQIEFGSGSAAIGTRSGALLDRLAREVRGCPGVMRIDGHTDTVGRGRFNRGLSEARAAAVRDALVARGAPAERLRTRGFAARRPARPEVDLRPLTEELTALSEQLTALDDSMRPNLAAVEKRLTAIEHALFPVQTRLDELEGAVRAFSLTPVLERLGTLASRLENQPNPEVVVSEGQVGH